MDDPMNWVLAGSGLMLGVAAFLLVMRITMGPTILDRSMALDVLMSVLVCAVAVDAARGNDTDGLPTLLVVGMVGFAGSVAVARYASGSDDLSAEQEDRAARAADLRAEFGEDADRLFPADDDSAEGPDGLDGPDSPDSSVASDDIVRAAGVAGAAGEDVPGPAGVAGAREDGEKR